MQKKVLVCICILVIIIAVSITVLVIQHNSSNGDYNKIRVTISVFDKENSNIFNRTVDTDKEYLIDVLNDINELNLVTQDSEYGAYITSVMGIEQDSNYYWSYYIDDEYATVGVSSCKVEDGKTYNLKYEEIIY